MTISISLGARLQTVASFVPEGAELGDIGTDHAYLPIALYEAQRIFKAVAVDVHEGPYQSALNTVKGRNLEAFIDVRFGDGLKPLEPGEVNALTLAGMGGRTMLDILSARPDVLDPVTDLILQPQGAERALRLALLDAGWRLKEERLVKEEERIYVVLALSKQEGGDISQLQDHVRHWSQRLQSLQERFGIPATEFQDLVSKLVWHFGPLVLEARSQLLSEYINEYCGRLLKQLEQMKQSKSPEMVTKIRMVCNELTIAEGLRAWQ